MKNSSQRTCSPCQLVALCLAMAAVPAFAGYNEYNTADTGNIRDVTLTVNDTIISDKLSGNGIDTLRFTRSDSFYSVKLRSNGGNDLPGGIIADGYTLKIQNPNVLGMGPVVLTNNNACLYGDSYSALSQIDVHNRVVFDTVNSWAAGENAKPLILHNIGVTGKNTAKAVALGRTETRQSTVTLALDGNDNDPIGYFTLRGNLALTINGGTLRAAAAEGTRALFQTANQATPTLTILNAPLMVDVADGGDVWFGVSQPTYSKTQTITNVVEEYKPDNWSFESGRTGWSITTGDVYEKGDFAFDGNGMYATTNGTKYAMVRHDNTISRSITLPSAGLWKVVFEQGCRGGDYSIGITATVTIDDSAVMEIPGPTAPYGFKEFRSEAVQLTSGSHTFKIALGSGTTNDANNHGSLNFDAIRFERIEVTTPGFSLAKTGAGSLTLSGKDFPSATSDLPIDVENGILELSAAALSGNSISVASGGELTLSGVAATNTTITVASGGIVSFGTTNKNLVVNGSFETPSITTYGYKWLSECKWTLLPSSGDNGVRAGIQHNGSDISKLGAADLTPYGDQSLYLRTGTTAEQSISVPVDGDYVLSFWQAPRNYAASQELALTVTIDGNEVVVNPGQSARYEPYRTSQVVSLAAGSHTLKFACAAGGGAGSMLFVDDVSLKAVSEPNDFATSTLTLASGATVRLNNAAKMAVGTVTVDGAKIRGGANALRAVGVTVEGNGRIQCGGPTGLTMFLR